MGSFFSKSNRRLDSIFMEGFEDDESLLIFNQHNNYNNDIIIRGIQELTNKIRNLESENKSLRGELNKYRNSINVEVDLGIGSNFFTVYTCDFTHDYIDINADYRN